MQAAFSASGHGEAHLIGLLLCLAVELTLAFLGRPLGFHDMLPGDAVVQVSQLGVPDVGFFEDIDLLIDPLLVLLCLLQKPDVL